MNQILAIGTAIFRVEPKPNGARYVEIDPSTGEDIGGQLWTVEYDEGDPIVEPPPKAAT